MTAGKETYTIKRRRIWLCLILCAVTFGIYQWIWFYNILKDSDKISTKRRKVLLLYWVTIGLLVLAEVSLIISLSVIIIGGKIFNTLTIDKFFIAYAEIPMALAITATFFSILALLLVLAEFVLIYILIFKLAKNLEEAYIYYFVPLFLFGILIPLIYAQSMINSYSGTYQKGEPPAYLRGVVA